jgi:pilus assembly protein Flp/PilA
MRALMRGIRAFAHDRKGATAVEYGFILALIVLALMTALIGLADTTTSLWYNISNTVQSAH